MAQTLEQVQARLQLYYDAEAAILSGQSYSLGNRSLSRPNLKEVQEQITKLENEESRLKGGGGLKVRRIVPL